MATAHLQFQTQPVKPKRRRCRETTITATSSDHGLKTDNGGAAGLDTSARDLKTHQPPSAMDYCTAAVEQFNSALTAGLLSPPPQVEKIRSSPTLFEMMANETDRCPRNDVVLVPPRIQQNPKAVDKQALMQQRVIDLVSSRWSGDQFKCNDDITGDVKLNLSSKDGISVSMIVHRQILTTQSRVFALKFNDEWSKQENSQPISVEISCEDIESYLEVVGLMYSRDLRKKLMKEDVPRVLGILKVSAAIGYDTGVLSCLEFLEASPWDEDEEEKVAALLSELSLEGVGVGEVLKRVSTDVRTSNEEVLVKLLRSVLEGKDEKARQEMKSLLTKMLHENSSPSDLSKESLYSACDDCLKSLRHRFLRAADSDFENVSQIARQADNLHWLLDILIDRQIAEDFFETWASQSEMSEAHARVPAVHRYEVSRVTARLLVGVGKAQLLVSKEVRCRLLQTWLAPFYDDFGWMRRGSKGLDRCLIEESLSSTILTLPMPWQQEILLSWFRRFLDAGDDCPNIQRAFQAWWRRAFGKRGDGLERHPGMRIVARRSDER